MIFSEQMEHCCLSIKVEDFWQHDMFTLLKKLNENLEFLINNNTIINNHNIWCCFLSLLHWTKIEQNFRLTNQANFYFSKSHLLLQRIICLVNRKISSPICCIIVFQKLCCESHRYRSFRSYVWTVGERLGCCINIQFLLVIICEC